MYNHSEHRRAEALIIKRDRWTDYEFSFIRNHLTMCDRCLAEASENATHADLAKDHRTKPLAHAFTARLFKDFVEELT